MSLKEHEYVRQTLERYTNCKLEQFCDHVLITNFKQYIKRFQEKTKGKYSEGNFRIVNSPEKNCTMIDFGIGSPQAALIINCLAYLDNLKSVIMLGMCGGIDDTLEVGNFLVPSAAIRGEGTSNDYFPSEVPALPSFKLHKFVSDKILAHGVDYRTGVIYTTNRRVWEHDLAFHKKLHDMTCIGIDMETATLFIVGHANAIAHGALLLVSDVPVTPEGVKTEESDRKVTENWVDLHLRIGIEAMTEIGQKGEHIKHFRY